MADRLTDAVLIETLQVRRAHPDLASAAGALGLSERVLRERTAAAKARGLTASSMLADPMTRLKLRVAALERENRALQRSADTAERIREEIHGLAATPPRPPSWLTEPAGLAPDTPGVPMVLWSDWHWGERVFKDEVGGVNQFDRRIAKQRVRVLTDKIRLLAMGHMVRPVYPGIVVMLGGDFITGDIHDELRETNEGTVQEALLEVEEHLIAALDAMAHTFGRVFVPCVVGNHGRGTLKPRAKHRIYTSFEWNLYCHLERHFRKDSRFLFMVPNETDARFRVFGHRFTLTHGDALGVRGGDGIIGALGPIARGAMKVGRSEAHIGRDFDTLVMGHWHTYIPRGDAVPVIVNGPLKGYDEFARIFLRAPFARPSQALWFLHPVHGVTSQWQIFLDAPPTPSKKTAWVSFEPK